MLKPDFADKCRDFIRHPEKWPRWPVLPLKRYHEEGVFPELAALLFWDTDWYEFRPGVLGLANPRPWQKLTETQALALVDAGWEVD